MNEYNQRNNGPHELSPKVPEEVLRISISAIAPAMLKRCNLFPDMATSADGQRVLAPILLEQVTDRRNSHSYIPHRVFMCELDKFRSRILHS
jgi:hypothetical protein